MKENDIKPEIVLRLNFFLKKKNCFLNSLLKDERLCDR